MHPTTLFRLAIAQGLMVVACATQASTDAPIARVTLYPDSAVIERVAKVPVGAATAEIACVPANFNEHSLRVEPSMGVKVGTVTVQELDAQKMEACRHSEWDDRIHALEERLDQVTAESQATDLASTYLKSLSEHAGGVPDSKLVALPSAGALTTSADALTHSARGVFANQQRLQRQKDELIKELEPLRKQRERMVSHRGGDRAILISVGASQSGELRISYQVNGAGWTPGYRANLLTANSTVQLERLAVMAQRTGEDWRHVELRLSTGHPQLAPEGPQASTWALSAMENKPVFRAATFAPAMADAPAPLAMARSAQSDAEAPLFPVSVVDTDFMTEFEAPHPVDLRSDGQKITVALTQQMVPVKLTVRATPSLSSDAYLLASGEPLAGVWPSGNLVLMRDGAAVGSTMWRPVGAERVSLPFGKDDLLRIKVEPAGVHSGTTGLLTARNERRLNRNYSITSLHKQPIDLELLEASPVSTDEQITVQSAYSIQPTSKDWEGQAGVMAWHVPLNAQATLKLAIDYVITYPKTIRVLGLP